MLLEIVTSLIAAVRYIFLLGVASVFSFATGSMNLPPIHVKAGSFTSLVFYDLISIIIFLLVTSSIFRTARVIEALYTKTAADTLERYIAVEVLHLNQNDGQYPQVRTKYLCTKMAAKLEIVATVILFLYGLLAFLHLVSIAVRTWERIAIIAASNNGASQSDNIEASPLLAGESSVFRQTSSSENVIESGGRNNQEANAEQAEAVDTGEGSSKGKAGV